MIYNLRSQLLKFSTKESENQRQISMRLVGRKFLYTVYTLIVSRKSKRIAFSA